MLLEIPEHVADKDKARFGFFTFHVGVDAALVEAFFQRVSEAHERCDASPPA